MNLAMAARSGQRMATASADRVRVSVFSARHQDRLAGPRRPVGGNERM